MNQGELQDAIWDVLSPLLPRGVSMVWAKQSAPAPTKPYVTLDFLTYGRRIGHDELRQYSDGFAREGLREFTLSINCFGEGAIDALNQLQNGLELTRTVEALALENLAAFNPSDVRDLSAKVEQRWEPRAQLDLSFYRTVSTDEVSEYFDRAEINDTIVELTEV